MARLKGLDVSKYQGEIDWARVPDDVRFVVIKAAEGTAYRDSQCARNLREARLHGRFVGVYTFCLLAQDPVAHARWLWDAIGDTLPDLPPVLDVESAPDEMSPTAIVEWVLAAADEMERYFGKPPLVYTYPDFAKRRIAPGATGELGARLARTGLWIADYSKGVAPAESATPFLPKPWSDWVIWQTVGDKSPAVPGVASAHVDHNVFNGDEAEMRALCGLPDPVATKPYPTIHPPVPMDDDEEDPPEGAA